MYSITTIILIVICITMGCILYLSDRQEISQTYTHCSPLLHISQPGQAYIFSADNAYDIKQLKQCFFSTATLPPASIWNNRTPDTQQPIFIALYPNNNTAIWCAIKPEQEKEITAHITDSISNGFEPIIEEYADGKLLHFSTKDNKFLHLYLGNCIAGCSYNESLLKHPDNDSTLNTIYHSAQHNSSSGLIFYDNEYRYADIHITQQDYEVRYTGHCDLPLDTTVTTIDTALITTNIGTLIQFSSTHNPSLSPLITLVYPTLSVDSTTHPIWIIPIINRNELRKQLRACYTPNGFIADSTTLSQWIPQEFIDHDSYSLATRQGILYISTSQQALRTYIKEIGNKNSYSRPLPSPASFTLITDSLNTTLLPKNITTLLPERIISKAKIIQITHTPKGHKFSIRY